MSRNHPLACACLLLISAALPASAEFYQYVDSKGIVHYTDTLSTIPSIYQSHVTQPQQAPVLPGEKIIRETGPSASQEDLEEWAATQKNLLEEIEALNRKHKLLTAEKERIENIRADMTDKADIIVYNQKVKGINAKIRKFKEEEKRLMAGIEKYNASLKPLTAE
ncbi:MAG: hypothetical protein COX19_08145 [Desulfobacterales bacterium CG23_combo_of_CG06-09_8_20_14_all_51_8]|nr:MAG: hypothetical protein COX19_08145 [Desulfobacterales bacterium CG23_combo_of_CG06-09_8_20_14_all_51_8]